MNILVNGMPREMPSGSGLAELLEALGLEPGATVVEHNGSVLDRAEYPVLRFAEGDALELVRFVGGG